MLLQLEVAGQIVYLLILIVVLIFAIRKRKSNNSRGGGGQAQAPVSVSFTSDDGDTSSGTQIAMGPTSLAFSTTYHGLLRKITFMHEKKKEKKS